MTDPNLAAGREALLQGRPDAAAPLFAAALERAPADHEARYWLASALMLLGDPDGAEATLGEARTLQTLALARELGADLGQLKTDAAYANDMGLRFYGRGLIAMASIVWGM